MEFTTVCELNLINYTVMQKVYYIYNYLVNYCIRKETHEMQKKWNEYQIIDTRQLVNKLPEDEREQYKFKVLFKNKALTDSVMMFSKADFKKYRENNDAFIVGKIRKRQKRYDTFDSKNEFLEAVKECKLPDGSFDNRYDFTIYNNYHEIISGEYNQVLDDIKDLGLWHNDKWDFYLTRNELETMGVPKDFIDHTLAVEKDLDMEKE